MEGNSHWKEYGECQDIFGEEVINSLKDFSPFFSISIFRIKKPSQSFVSPQIHPFARSPSLTNRYNSTLELEDAVHTAILTLKEGYEGVMTESTIEIGIAYEEEEIHVREGKRMVSKFRKLSTSEVKDYLSNIA